MIWPVGSRVRRFGSNRVGTVVALLTLDTPSVEWDDEPGRTHIVFNHELVVAERSGYCACDEPLIDVEHDAGCRRCGLPVDFVVAAAS
jgi:hypothetical protein